MAFMQPAGLTYLRFRVPRADAGACLGLPLSPWTAG